MKIGSDYCNFGLGDGFFAVRELAPSSNSQPFEFDASSLYQANLNVPLMSASACCFDNGLPLPVKLNRISEIHSGNR